MECPRPQNEHRRLEALNAYGILDTPPEAGFEHITAVVTRLFGVAIAAVTLLDADRQWFKSVRGIEIQEIPRELSFCTHALQGRHVMVVPDTTLDPRFVNNPFVTGEPRVRFYAGAPLRTPEGHTLGTLCVIDLQPRQFSEADQTLLTQMAVLVEDELLLRRAAEELRANTLELQASKTALAEERDTERRLRLRPRPGPGLGKGKTHRATEAARSRADTEGALLEGDRFRQLVEQVDDALFVYDLEGRFVDVNRAACKLIGYEREELLRLYLTDIEITFDPVKGPQRWREMVVGEAVTMEGLGRRKDRSIFAAEARISVVETKDSRVLLALVRDISERKRAEELLRSRARQQQAIAKLGTVALSSRDLDALFDDALQIVGETLNVKLCRVLEHVTERGAFVVRAGLNLPEDRRGTTATAAGSGSAAAHVLATGEPIIIRDFDTEQRFRRTAWLEAERAICGLCVPIGSDDSDAPRYGILGAYSSERREFTDDDLYFLHAMANVLAAAIARQRGEDALRVVEGRYQRIVANTSAMVFQLVMQPDYTFTAPFISEGCRQIYEREPAQVQADPRIMNRVVHPEDKERYKQLLRTSVETLEPFHWEGRVLLPSGTLRWVAARSQLDRQPNGDVIWNGVVLDVTELKQAQETALAAKEEAERANSAKSHFLSRMSHELRTPLNAILGFGQLLELGQLDEQNGDCVQHILKGGRHLLSLVDEVLDLARVESGELAIKPMTIPVSKFMQECLGFVVKLAEARGITCTLALVPASCAPVWADEQRLRQVLLNLLSNAIKYNHVGGQVSLGCDLRPDGRLRLNVTDTGPGISPEGLTRLFVPFERLGQEFGEVEGTGLGLVVCKHLVEAMGGSLGVESHLGQGTNFWIELPTSIDIAAATTSNHQLANASTIAPAIDSERETLLYIEDNPSNLQVIEMVVSRMRPQWRFLSSQDGESGLELARENHPGVVVLLDLQLPGMKGDAVLEALRADPKTRAIPVLLLSADATAESREQLMSLGATDYVTKPFEIFGLLERLDALFLAAKTPV